MLVPTRTGSGTLGIPRPWNVVSAIAVGTPLAVLAALSVVNSFIGHMTPDISGYLLDARTFVETLNRFTLSWDSKGIMLMFLLALPVRVFGATMAAAALTQLCAHVAGLYFLFRVARSYADRWSSGLLVLLATCVIYSSSIWGGRVRPENFAFACCAGCLYAGLRAKPKWWIAGGAMTASCLFLKISLAFAPGVTLITATIEDAISQGSPRGKQQTLFLSTLARDLGWVLLGFAAIAGAVLTWIVAFDDLGQMYRQTIEFPMENSRTYYGPRFQNISFLRTPIDLLAESRLEFLFVGCLPGLVYGWFKGFRREASLFGVLLMTECLRVAIERSAYPYLLTIMLAPMLLGVAFFGSGKKDSTTSMLGWIAPLCLLVPLLIPTAREQVSTFDLRVVKRLPAPYEYLAQQLSPRYRPGELIYVNANDQQIVLWLNAPRPFPIRYDTFVMATSQEERSRTVKQYQERPPNWIITREPQHSSVTFETWGSVDGAYHVYLPTGTSIRSGDTTRHDPPPSRTGSSLAVVGSPSSTYTLEVDTGYLQAWHLRKQ
ncbi:MAG TPA: glycosyltransferase family 39 protein [Nitrospira sp.]|nr:glycosyltransferase family 39 protein [Nitrospira sp.]